MKGKGISSYFLQKNFSLVKRCIMILGTRNCLTSMSKNLHTFIKIRINILWAGPITEKCTQKLNKSAILCLYNTTISMHFFALKRQKEQI